MLGPCASTWQLHALAYVLVCIATVVRRPSAAIVIVHARTPDLLISTISDSSQFMRNSYKAATLLYISGLIDCLVQRHIGFFMM